MELVIRRKKFSRAEDIVNGANVLLDVVRRLDRWS
jgi:hypothetical protein